MSKIPRRYGFSLIELLVVISIIGILSSIILSSLQTARVNAAQTKVLADMRQIGTALNLYYDDHGHYPYFPGMVTADTTQNTWYLLQDALKPYMQVPAPEFTSSTGGGFITAGYQYNQGGPHTGIKVRLFNFRSGEYKACVAIYDGFYLLATVPGGQTTVTERDGGPALGSIDPLMSAYGRTDILPPGDCPSDRSTFPY